MCVFEPEWVYMQYIHTMPMKARSCRVPISWSYRQLWVAMWVLRHGSGYFIRTVCIFNRGAICPVCILLFYRSSSKSSCSIAMFETEDSILALGSDCWLKTTSQNCVISLLLLYICTSAYPSLVKCEIWCHITKLEHWLYLLFKDKFY